MRLRDLMQKRFAQMPRWTENILLDIDGTLLDSNEQHAQSWKQLLDGEGRELPLGMIRLLMGMGGDKILEKVFGSERSEKEIEKLTTKRDNLYLSDYFHAVDVIPGALEFMRALFSRGYRVALCTSMREELLEGVLAKLPVLDYCVGYTHADDADGSKPDPDIFLAAIRKFGFEPARTVVVGDTPYDIEAARQVPCRVIAVGTGGYPYNLLTQADEFYENVMQLTRKLDDSLIAA